MRIEPSKPRFTVLQTVEGVTVSAPARRNWLILLVLTAWLCVWTFGGTVAMSEVLHPGPDQAFLVLWLVGWLLGELYAVSILLWQLAGREELTFSGGNLIHRVAVGALGHAREFSGANIKHLRPSLEASAPWTDQRRWRPPLFGSGHGAIAFDYGAKTYRIGAGLDEAEGRLVLAEIQKRFPRMVESAT